MNALVSFQFKWLNALKSPFFYLGTLTAIDLRLSAVSSLINPCLLTCHFNFHLHALENTFLSNFFLPHWSNCYVYNSYMIYDIPLTPFGWFERCRLGEPILTLLRPLLATHEAAFSSFQPTSIKSPKRC